MTSHLRLRAIVWLAAASVVLTLSAAAQSVKITSEMLEGISARPLGPAAMSGRIAAIDAYAGDRLTIYVGSASGGVWKSANGGITFKPVFDKQTQSIGAVAIDPSNPETVWVGTGESWVRNSVSVGTGVYKTTDGGDNWQALGLVDTEHISRILVHPRDSKTVYVCALGHLWNSNAERGVFRTTDGGQKWEKVLFVNEDTGCSDIAMDPQEPKILYAGMWQARRRPWTFTSGGPGSGLYKSTDGGATWRPVRKGIAVGDLGRIAIAVASSRPNVVYAVVEAKKTALYRSDDLGENWTEINSSGNIQSRPFYFATLAVDPKDFNRVYKPGFMLTVSDDGGKTFSGISIGDAATGPGVHSDHHAIWINPKNTNHLIEGTDGGVYISYDRGSRWRLVGTLPVSQFYHVSYDMDQPYNVYGGLQDNGTWMGPSQHTGGISSRHWRTVGFGDGFWALVDPQDQDLVYVEWQGGKLQRVRRSTLETKNIYPFARQGEPELRFNWNTPIHLSPTQTGALYIGAQYLFRSRDRGESWERVSPDLTTNDPQKLKQEESGGLTTDNSTAENHCTIFAISASPKNASVIWAGTDDGNLQVTRDTGKTWTNMVKGVPGLPPSTWVSSVEAGHFDEGTAYATFDGHTLGDMKTYVYRTRDFGQTWQSLATADVKGYAHVIRQDMVNPTLLFLGTEFGLFVSFDDGANWAQFTGGLPPVAVRDLAIHPREADLIIATHGRGIYVVDDVTPLRKLTPAVIESEVAFLEGQPSVLRIPAGEQRFDGDAEYTAYSPEGDASLNYYLKKRHMFGDLRIDILDAKGAVMYSAPGNRRRGLNRFDWPMRLKPPKAPPATELGGDLFSLIGPLIPEGTYTVRMTKGKDTYTTQVKLVADPRSKHTAEDRTLARQTALKLYQMIERLTFVAESLVDLRDKANARAGQLPKGDPLKARLETFVANLEKLRKTLVSTHEGGGISGEIRLREKILSLYGMVNGYEGRPTQSQLERMTVLEKDLQGASSQFDGVTSSELAGVNSVLEKKKLEPLKLMTLEEWRKKGEKK
ncbi:MAG: glycosyl hydrolase [Acidobacteria bacterium]|nr:glycosyl hydrolase [Acidobacteriota bacterium]MBI3664530.1 glycosyl hydrolase [Acidobacteriota bacterium]